MKKLIALLCVMAILLCAIFIVGCQDKDNETPDADPSGGENPGGETPGGEDAGGEETGGNGSGNGPVDPSPGDPTPDPNAGQNLEDSYVSDNFQ